VRRGFLAAIAGITVLPSAAIAAPAGKAKRLAIFSVVGEGTEDLFGPMLNGLAQRGYRRDGRDANLEVVVFKRDSARLDGPSNDDLARAVVDSSPDVIVTVSTQATAALQRRTRSIPIVTSVGDPVRSGFAQSVARPGGNITGLSQGFEIGAVKGVEAVRVLLPGLRRLAIFHSSGPAGTYLAGVVAQAAQRLAITAHSIPVDEDAAARKAIEGLRGAGIQAACWLLSGADPLLAAKEAIRHRIALVSIGGDMTDVGLLASYSSSIPNFQDRLAAIAARVLAGEKPATLPFELPSEFTVALNLRTARALGLEIPPELRVRANRVVE
jgi:putative ABC transport system substrate-binding protein